VDWERKEGRWGKKKKKKGIAAELPTPQPEEGKRSTETKGEVVKGERADDRGAKKGAQF